MSRYFSKLKNAAKRLFSPNPASEREELTNKLKENAASDVDRWKQDEQLFADWNARTAILASYTQEGASIIEFGAGVMFMKTILKPGQTYAASDIVQRYDETLVCDLNEPIPFDLKQFDTAVFSGVLEYVYDARKVFAQLKNAGIRQVALSYCCSDIVKLTRAKNGWLSDYTRAQIEAVFQEYGYEIVSYDEWRSQSLYNLRRI